VGETFDHRAAWALRDRVDLEAAPEVVVDFSRVLETTDLATAILAHGVQSSRRRILFRGLRPHQVRIFRYCGVSLEEAGPPGALAAATLPELGQRV
jgi:hypothetical protein